MVLSPNTESGHLPEFPLIPRPTGDPKSLRREWLLLGIGFGIDNGRPVRNGESRPVGRDTARGKVAIGGQRAVGYQVGRGGEAGAGEATQPAPGGITFSFTDQEVRLPPAP